MWFFIRSAIIAELRQISIVLQFARILFEDSTDEEDNDDNVLAKVENYAELTVPAMSDKQFKMNFRMTVEAFEDLLRKMHIVLQADHYNHTGFPKTELEKEALLTI